MRELFTRTGGVVLVAGLALAVAACGGDTETADEAENNLIDSNMILDEPANDASAMESVGDVTQPVDVIENETGNDGNDADAAETLGETSGGDTGGNTVDSNVSGM